MMAVIVDIADAVVAALNAETFSQPFTAVRYYRPVFELKDMDTLHVSVVPKTVESSIASRRSYEHDYQIDIAVQKRPAQTNAVIDPLMTLVEEIADHFLGLTLDSPEAICVAVVNEPVYAPEHIGELRLFTSVLTLTFRMWR